MRKTKKTFIFTNKDVRELTKADDYRIVDVYYDDGCPNLILQISRTEKSFIYRYANFTKRIGSVYQVSVEEARKIVHNINDNKEEFMSLNIPKRYTIFDDFQKNGYLPRQKNEVLDEIKGTATILSAENISLKKKIKELEEKIAELEDQQEERNISFVEAIKALMAIYRLSKPFVESDND